MEALLAKSAELLQRPIRATELEDRLPGGDPVLPGGLRDNPLVPGVGAVVEACEVAADTPADWAWCPHEGRMQAVIPRD